MLDETMSRKCPGAVGLGFLVSVAVLGCETAGMRSQGSGKPADFPDTASGSALAPSADASSAQPPRPAVPDPSADALAMVPPKSPEAEEPAVPPGTPGPIPNLVKPNVLFIASDDLNDWVGFLDGHPQAKTPNLDRLAARSYRFTNAHVQAAWCNPSRASFLSGLYPQTSGVYQGEDANGSKAIASATWLHKWFEKQGYKTEAVGKIHHRYLINYGNYNEWGGHFGQTGPFPPKNFRVDLPGTASDWGAFPDSDDQMPDTKIAQWAAGRLGMDHDKPLFLAVGFVRPHVPWYVPKPWFDLHPLDKVMVPPILESDYDDIPAGGKQMRHEALSDYDWMKKNNYLGEAAQAMLAAVTFVDSRIGMLLDALEASKYKDNTIIVFLSDHGYHVGEKLRWAKFSLWEETTRVPLLISLPGQTKSLSIDQPVGLIDLYPTLLDLSGLPQNPKNEGLSLRPLMENPATTTWRKAIRTTHGRGNDAVRDTRYRLIRYSDGGRELYDHEKDPQEWKNLADDPTYAAVMRDLEKHLP